MAKIFTSKNPVLKESALEKSITRAEGNLQADTSYEAMTVDGAINKTLMLFGIMMITTILGFLNPSMLNIMVGAIGGLIAVIVASIKPHTSPYTAPIYALLEGLFVGSISALFAYESSGIILQAVSLTFGTLIMMLAIYKSGLIEVTDKFRSGVVMATGAIMLMYILSFALSFFGINIPYLHEGGLIGIGISLVIIVVAALNLLLDFDSFEKGAAARAPKYMEWLCAMGLLVTLVWLYIEFLRLLSMLQSD